MIHGGPIDSYANLIKFNLTFLGSRNYRKLHVENKVPPQISVIPVVQTKRTWFDNDFSKNMIFALKYTFEAKGGIPHITILY